MPLRFPNLLNQPYESTNFLRTRVSAKQFATGLFGQNDVKKVLFDEPLDKDPLLKFYKGCQKWRKDVKESSLASAEDQQFVESQLTNVTLKKVYLEDLDLVTQDVKNVYTYCDFETAWEKNKVLLKVFNF
ncbi:hypothetical protein QTP88_016102 [Uroleucon formosanum]